MPEGTQKQRSCLKSIIDLLNSPGCIPDLVLSPLSSCFLIRHLHMASFFEIISCLGSISAFLSLCLGAYVWRAAVSQPTNFRYHHGLG